MAGFKIDQVAAEFYDGQIVLEKLRKVERTPSLVALLVKIDCPDAVLVLFEIRSHLHDVIVGPHVTEEPDEATLVELDEFLGQTNSFRSSRSRKLSMKSSPGTPMICSSTRVSRST